VITRRRIDQFGSLHPDSKNGLESWFSLVSRAKWASLAEVRKVYPKADLVGRRTVFNISGNKYRLIARINYRAQVIFVLFILTHKENDRGGWK